MLVIATCSAPLGWRRTAVTSTGEGRERKGLILQKKGMLKIKNPCFPSGCQSCHLPPPSLELSRTRLPFQLPAGRIKEEIWRAGADVTAELTLACMGQHAVPIKRNALHWQLRGLRMLPASSCPWQALWLALPKCIFCLVGMHIAEEGRQKAARGPGASETRQTCRIWPASCASTQGSCQLSGTLAVYFGWKLLFWEVGELFLSCQATAAEMPCQTADMLESVY